jgi:3-deoxy-manno-octulosonate cytidylyltransferase (CMP-KDO synthetase)
MIARVWRQAIKAEFGPVLVAAAEEEIANEIRRAGGEAVLTDPALPSGSDRVHQALLRHDPEARFDCVINLQGDLPALDPAAIRSVGAALEQSGADIATLAAEIRDPRDGDNPAVVKAIAAWNASAARGRALYFTRARAPFGDGPLFHHVGIYAFRRGALARFVSLPVSPLEAREKLEQLRALEAGMHIEIARIDEVPLSVDTPEDLERARRILRRG